MNPNVLLDQASLCPLGGYNFRLGQVLFRGGLVLA